MINFRKLFLLGALCCVTFAFAQQKVSTYHTIVKGETLFQLTQKYQVTAEAICALNPGLSAQNFQAGKTIAIPEGNGAVEQHKKVETITTDKPANAQDWFKEMHKVKKGETIYGLCQQYGLTEQELMKANPDLQKPNAKLKKGSFIVIPYRTIKTIQDVAPENEELFAKSKPKVSYFGRMKIAIMLPFGSTDKAKRASAIMYYRGFMLAINSLKSQGINMELTICDTGRNEEKVDSLLHVSAIQDLDLLFCPQVERNERKIADFARSHQIRTVFTQTDQVNNNPYLYSMNAATQLLYQDAADFFVRKFAKANVIILDMKDSNARTSRGQFTDILKKTLSDKGINYTFLAIDSSNDLIQKTLQTAKQNVIVPNSASLPLMKKMMNQWKKVVDNKPSLRVSVFGHKEWLSMASDMKTQFYALDTYIYSKVWFNPGNASSKQLAADYQKWYNDKLPTIMPSVPTIGYDTAFYIIKGLSNYGTAFEEHLKDFTTRTYQNFIEFERAGTMGGFVNRKVGYVHFNKKVVNVEY